jgi:hypothetical protein
MANTVLYVFGTSYAPESLVPRVIYPADDELIINDLDYMGDGATTFVAGDLIRITTAGTIKKANVDTTNPGSIHGMILKDYAAPSVTTPVCVCLFDENTIIRIQVYAVNNTDAIPSNYIVGTSHVLVDGGSAHWSIVASTSSGNMLVTRQPSYSNVADVMLGAAIQNGVVDVRVPRSILDGRYT